MLAVIAVAAAAALTVSSAEPVPCVIYSSPQSMSVNDFADGCCDKRGSIRMQLVQPWIRVCQRSDVDSGLWAMLVFRRETSLRHVPGGSEGATGKSHCGPGLLVGHVSFGALCQPISRAFTCAGAFAVTLVFAEYNR